MIREKCSYGAFCCMWITSINVEHDIINNMINACFVTTCQFHSIIRTVMDYRLSFRFTWADVHLYSLVFANMKTYCVRLTLIKKIQNSSKLHHFCHIHYYVFYRPIFTTDITIHTNRRRLVNSYHKDFN